MARKIEIVVGAETANAERAFKSLSHSATLSASSLVKVAAGIGAITAAVRGISTVVRAGISEFSEQEKVAAQTAAAIESTGAVAGVSAKQIDALALSLSNLSGIDDEVVKAGENVLLAFTNIRNSAGKGNDIFNQATKAAVDFAARTGKTVPAAAALLGKALADPAKRVASLARAGVVFTQQQIKQIAAIQKTSGVMAAQKVVLAEFAKRFGGAAKALGDTLPGQLNVIRERLRDAAGALVGKLAPAFTTAARAATDFITKFSAASGLQAKVDVVFDTARNLAARIQSALADAVARIDWDAVWARATGIADGLQAQLEQVDFGKVGERIGAGIAEGVKKASEATKEIAGRISAVLAAIDFVALGKKIGPGLVAALVTAFAAVLDPVFWIKNWDLALAVASAAFTRGIGRIAGKLGADLALALAVPLERLAPRLAGALIFPLKSAARAAETGVLAIATAVERVAPRIAAGLLRGMVALPAAVIRALAPLARAVAERFAALGRVAQFVVKVLGIQAVIDAVARLVASVSGSFSQLGAFIGGALDAAWKKIEAGAIRAALAVIEPFSHIPKRLGGGAFQGIKAELEAKLAGLAKPATAAGKAVAKNFLEGAQSEIDGFHLIIPAPTIAKPAGSVNRSAAVPAAAATTTPTETPAKRTGITAAQRNTFFDAALARQLDRVQDSDLKAQLAKLKSIAALISARIAATKDITRRLNLEDKLVAVIRQAKSVRDQIAQQFIDALDFNLEKAGDNLPRQLAALKKLEMALTARLALDKSNLDLQRRLFAVSKQRESVEKQQASIRQFRALGLNAEGGEIVPGIENLRKQFKSLQARLASSFADTGRDVTLSSKLKAQFEGVRKILSGSLGKTTVEVREKIQELFQTIRDEFDKGGSKTGPLTKTTSANLNAIVAGVTGLSPAQLRRLKANASQFNSAGVGLAAANGPGGVFGVASQTIVVQSPDVLLDGAKVSQNGRRHNTIHARRNPPQRRGRRK